MKRVFRRPSPAMVIAMVALLAALGGTAVGAKVLNKKKVKNIANNEITKRAPGLSVASANRANSAATADKANNVLSASVGGGCTVNEATQPGTTATTASSTPPASSACNVDFSRNVTACTYVATIGEAGGGESSRGFVTTAETVGNPEAVFVRTTNLADTFAIRPFHLQWSAEGSTRLAAMPTPRLTSQQPRERP